jgi:hypothetical protein
VHVVVPDRPYLRRRTARLSDELRSPDDRSSPWLEWEHPTGDWSGLRPRLHERGIIPTLELSGQLLSNLRGRASESGSSSRAPRRTGT